jgi:hypothetical protein
MQIGGSSPEPSSSSAQTSAVEPELTSLPEPSESQTTAPSTETEPQPVSAGASSYNGTPSDNTSASSTNGSPASSNQSSADKRLDARLQRKVDNEKLDGQPFDKWKNQAGAKGAAAKGGHRFASYMKNHPKGMVFGVVALLAALFGSALWFLSIPFQLIHMAQLLLDGRSGPAETQIEQPAERRLIARLMQIRAKEPVGAKKVTGNPIADKLDNMRIDRFNKLLAKDNLKMQFDKTGRLTGIVDTVSGAVLEDLSDASFLERRNTIGNLVSHRISPWRVLKRVKYTKLMRFHARVSFKFWPQEKLTDIKKLLVEKIRLGASPAEIRAATGTNPDGSTTPADPKAQSGSDVANATAEEFIKTGDKAASIKAGLKLFNQKFSGTLGVSGIVAMVCSVVGMITEYSNNGYITRTEQLMRNGNSILTMVSQLRKGQNLDIEKFGLVMSRFNGDSTAAKTSNDHKGWDQSAAYRRLNKLPIVANVADANYNPDLNPASNPDGFWLNDVSNILNTIIDHIPGAKLVCAAANSLIGSIFLFITGILEVAGNVVDGETLEIAAQAAKIALQLTLTEKILPWALSMATDLAITGTENSVDFFNNADAGTFLSAHDYQRSYGGRRLKHSEQLALTNAHDSEQTQIAAEKGWFYQTLALANPHSLASQTLMKIPTNPSTAIADITSFPQNTAHTIAQILSGQPAQAVDINQINPYHLALYGFTKAEIDKYDPIDNEKYLTTPIAGTTQTRLSVLGDSTDYSPDDGDDTNSDDLMHCFVNKFRAPAELKDDHICAGIGSVTEESDTADNPGNDIVQQIYASHGLTGVTIDDDFLRYRLQLLYTHAIKGLDCLSNEEPCFVGKNIAGTTSTGGTVANTGPWKSGASCDGISDGSFANFRHSALGIAGTWNDISPAAQQAVSSVGGEYGAWSQSLDVAIGGIWKDQGESWAAAANGAYDARLHAALANINASWGTKKTIYIRYAHEFNGDWFKWTVNNGENADFIKASRHFYDLVQSDLVAKGRDAKVVWSPNYGGHQMDTQQNWPGDDKVDVVGVDTYDNEVSDTQAKWDTNFQRTDGYGSPQGTGAWQAFAKKHGKPIAFPEWGLSGSGPTEDPFYIQKMNEFFRANAGVGPGQVLYEVYFNCSGGWNGQFALYPNTQVPQSAAEYAKLSWGATAAADAAPAAADVATTASAPRRQWWDVGGLLSGWAMDFVRSQTQGALDY